VVLPDLGGGGGGGGRREALAGHGGDDVDCELPVDQYRAVSEMIQVQRPELRLA
jgi:hypothetical protein